MLAYTFVLLFALNNFLYDIFKRFQNINEDQFYCVFFSYSNYTVCKTSHTLAKLKKTDITLKINKSNSPHCNRKTNPNMLLSFSVHNNT